MNCQRCGSVRLVRIHGKSVDLNFVDVPHLNIEGDGYVPNFIGEYGDYISFTFCADCGTIQDDNMNGISFPISDATLKRDIAGM